MIRSVCGSKGTQKGNQFVIDDPRSVFYLPEDRQVIVYFEWDGPTGQHHFEGFWKNPQGKAVVFSDFSYEARQKRFAGYWTLPLSDAVTPGVWVMEAHVDGELAGTYNFEITVAPRPALPSPRPVLTPAELYKQLSAAIVSLEKLDAQRRRVGLASGFVTDGDVIVTTFENIEGANWVRVTTAIGSTEDLEGAVAWNRREGWAVLRLSTPLDKALELAKPGSWQIGDVCYSLDSPQEGNRAIASGNVTGNHKFPDVGERLNLNFRLSPRADGSPMVTEYGEVIGIVSSSTLIPGISSLGTREGELPTYPGNLVMRGLAPGIADELALPVTLIKTPQASAPITSFPEMIRSGQFAESLVKKENLLTGTVGGSVKRNNQQLLINDEKFDYERRGGQVSVLINWQGKGKLKASPILKIYDIDNKLVETSQPGSLNLSKGQLVYSRWNINISTLSPGLYRIDLVLNISPIGQTFFRITG